MIPVSIIMPVLNGEKYLREAIESVFRQSWSDFELVVVNDGSVDRTGNILASCPDRRLRVLSNDRTQGIATSLNRGVQSAQGKYIVRMDADDIAVPSRVKHQVDFLEKNPGIAMVGCNTLLIDAEGRTIGTENYPITDEDIRKTVWVHNPFAHGSVVLRRSVLDEVGLYSTRFLHNEDYDLWLRILSRFRAANLPDRLLMRRVHGASISGSHEIEMVRNRWHTLAHAVFDYYRKPHYAIYLVRPLAAYGFRVIRSMFN